MKLPIILIGPMYAGKSTIGALLAEQLSLPHISVDEIAAEYYRRSGASADTIREAQETLDADRYFELMHPFEIQAALAICTDHPDAVISFGAGHAYATTDEELDQLLILTQLTPNILLLMPSPDPSISERTLAERMEQDTELSASTLPSKKALNRRFLEGASFASITRKTVYTQGHTPRETAALVADMLL